MYHPAKAVLCCTAHVPWLQGELGRVILTEGLPGSSWLIPLVTPLACPCLYLKLQQQLPM